MSMRRGRNVEQLDLFGRGCHQTGIVGRQTSSWVSLLVVDTIGEVALGSSVVTCWMLKNKCEVCGEANRLEICVR